VLARYQRVLIPELNSGQLRQLIRARYLVDAIGLNRVRGRPLATYDITSKIDELLD
jgi:2-oxoglutarate ferredoxin oxidoreductase subunit alpha